MKVATLARRRSDREYHDGDYSLGAYVMGGFIALGAVFCALGAGPLAIASGVNALLALGMRN